MSVRSMLGRVRRKVMPNRYYRDPQAYWEQRHDEFGNSLEGSGRLHMSEEDNVRTYEQKWEHVRAAIEAIGEPTELLDAGCGIGWFTRRFLALGYRVTAIDFTKSGIDVARAEVPGDVTFEVSDIAGYRPGRTFPVVACIDVLFHVVDDDAWLAAVENLGALAAGGTLVIQDHLVEVAEPAPDPAAGIVHTRWRTLADYQAALPAGTLTTHDHYLLPDEEATKDLLVFAL